MTHEPECFYGGERDDTEWRDAEDSPCICEQLTTAYQRGRQEEQANFARWTNDAIDASERAKEYQRGREDAAKAVEAIHCPNPHGYIYPPGDGEAEDTIVCDSCWDGEYRWDVYPCETLLAARGNSNE